ncbi:MAG: hypothetical protein IT436_15735 [Phycisphaerales bacterium]|nr:hypothetical protein [Phycisphaerales bacterium]
MHEHECPACGTRLAANDIDIAAGVARCPSCRIETQLSILLGEADAALLDLAADEPAPPGCREWLDGPALNLVSPMREPDIMFVSVVFALMWNVATTIAIVLAATPNAGRAATPAWVWIVLCSVFVPAGLAAAALASYAAFGSLRFRVMPHAAWISNGVGPVRFSRQFDPRSATRVIITDGWFKMNGAPRMSIAVDAGRRLQAGAFMTGARRRWMAARLRRALLGGPGSCSAVS